MENAINSHSERYHEMRRRLVSYFDRRNRLAADDLADETLARIGVTLQHNGAIATTPARHCYVMAMDVLLEDVQRERVHLRRDRIVGTPVARVVARDELHESVAIKEQRVARLDRCLQELKPTERAIVVEYYRDTGQQARQRRRGLAKRLGVAMNALGVHAARLRRALEAQIISR